MTTPLRRAPRLKTDLLAFGRHALRSQAFNRLLDAEPERFERGRAVLSGGQPQLRQYHGLVHGGVQSYLFNNTLTFAGGSVPRGTGTVEFQIDHPRPVHDGGRQVAEAMVVDNATRHAACRCEVDVQRYDEPGKFTVAQGTVRAVGGPS